MHPLVSRVVYLLCAAYACVVVAGVVLPYAIPSLVTAETSRNGCHFNDELIACHGFLGAPIASAFFSLPRLLVFVPMIAVLGATELRPFAFIGLAFAAVIWAPIVYLVVCKIRRRVLRSWSEDGA